MEYTGYLLDTNIIIGLFCNDQAVVDFLRQAVRDRMPIYISAMTECEIFSGQKIEQDSHEISFLNTQRYIEINSKIARAAGNIRREQRQNGRKLKAPDAIIIASAREYRLALVSRDTDMNFIQSEYDIPLIKI
ncbi:MAG: PIN domain-containing protein [Parachlamydiaceae bacterium]|nr:PIN domain-containing protein [Parachlamydiaceae bacterium]